MQNLQPLAAIVPEAWKRRVLLRVGGDEGAHVDAGVDSARDARRAPPMSIAVLFLCCAVMVAIGNVRAQDDVNNIEFGNNLGDTAFDGACDDPRFQYLDARGSAPKPSGENMFRDAADCRVAFENQLVGHRDRQIPGMDLGRTLESNGRCEDPRFIVDPRRAANNAVNDAERQDAQDCFNAWLAGEVWPLHQRHEIAFGDDNGMWANDGTCDDPRFEGEGRSGATLRDQVLRDMTDCIEAYEDALRRGNEFRLTVPDESESEIEFGDNTGSWSFDGECDDPRFDGDGMSEFPNRSHLRRDAVDCYRAYEAGDVVLLSEVVTIDDFDFGDDNGFWPFDGECDDPRFEGTGVADGADDEKGDATDCRRAYRAKSARIHR